MSHEETGIKVSRFPPSTAFARPQVQRTTATMVKLALPLVVLATAVSAVSAAAVPAATSGTTFSFAKWVEDIAANPDTALTPDEAWAAAQAADAVGSAGGLKKRYADWKPLCTSSGVDGPRANVCLASLSAANALLVASMLTCWSV